MSLLGNIIGSALGGGGGNSGGGGQNMLMQAVMGMITQHGGIGGLQQKFQSNNLGSAFSSWIAPGANHAVSPEQITDASRAVADGIAPVRSRDPLVDNHFRLQTSDFRLLTSGGEAAGGASGSAL